jgi:inner membrane protein
MDPLTQATLGAAAAQCAAKPERFTAATLAGALAGFLPDADVLIRSPTDSLLFLDYHRHFTHSLFFIPVGAAITSGLCSVFSRGRVRFREVLLPCLLGWGTHGLLDSCTSYGTYLYWPFSNERVAWHVISIIDPLFTLPLLAGVVWAFRTQQARIARAFLALALAYVGFCAFQLHRAEAIQAKLIAERGHDAERTEVKPALGTNVLFRAFYEHEGAYYADAVRVSWLGSSRVYEGTSLPVFDRAAFEAAHPLDPVHRRDLDRFAYFSNDFLVLDPTHAGHVSDFRYAMVPDAVAPLWGVDVLGTPAGEHLKFTNFRNLSTAGRTRFVDMVLGR